jgi:hypothetical protein
MSRAASGGRRAESVACLLATGWAGLASWALVLLLVLAVPPSSPGSVWSVLSGVLVGALLAVGNVLLLQAVLQRLGASLLPSRLGWSLAWGGKLALLSALLYLSIETLHCSGVALAAGITLVLPLVLFGVLRRASCAAEPGTSGGDHGSI